MINIYTAIITTIYTFSSIVCMLIMIYNLRKDKKINDKRFSQVVKTAKQTAITKAKEKKKDE